MKELARKYNVSLSTLSNFKNNRQHFMEGASRRKFVEIDQANQKEVDS